MQLIKDITALLVEDQVLDAELMTKYLGKLGCKVKVAHCGQDALRILKKEHIDLVVCDINLSDDVDGFELLNQARMNKTAEELPIILVTASKVAPEMYERLHIDGGYDICQKWDGVIAKVRDFVRYHKPLETAGGHRQTGSNLSLNPFKRFSWKPW